MANWLISGDIVARIFSTCFSLWLFLSAYSRYRENTAKGHNKYDDTMLFIMIVVFVALIVVTWLPAPQ